jgi:hypothetical protein
METLYAAAESSICKRHAKRRRWRAAREWALERLSDHTVHMHGESFPLFPDGGLDAARYYADDAFAKFMEERLVLGMSQYEAFLGRGQ